MGRSLALMTCSTKYYLDFFLKSNTYTTMMNVGSTSKQLHELNLTTFQNMAAGVENVSKPTFVHILEEEKVDRIFSRAR